MSNRISISNLKVVKSRSYETFCFTASLSLDGKVIATVDNSGTGGPNIVRAKAGCVALVKEAESYALSLPATSYGEIELAMDLELLVGILVEDLNAKLAIRKEFDKVAKKGGFIRDGKIFTLKSFTFSKDPVLVACELARVKAKVPGVTFLIESEENFAKFCEIMK